MTLIQKKIMTKKESNKRRFSRVVLTRAARIRVGDTWYESCPINNLSLGGMQLQGSFQGVKGDFAEIELHETGKHSSLVLRMNAEVVRVDTQGIAVEFVDMEPDSMMFLQTMVLYSTDDPVGVALEFLDDFPSEQSY
jgi:hypothetical protein